MKRNREHRTGYVVWLFGEKFWHRTLRGARRRSLAATRYCNGEHNQVVRVPDAKRM
jgi:hypothetical protein